MSTRDNFKKPTIENIARKAGYLCSFPGCRKHTYGATADGERIINIGIAAHICAAAPGGPRYDETMTPEERSSENNGIWMCSDHAKIIDVDVAEYTVERLRTWKRDARRESFLRVSQTDSDAAPAGEQTAMRSTAYAAAEADLIVMRNMAKWPATDVELSLRVPGIDEVLTSSNMARIVASLDDLILVAPPGMGKTATLCQIAQHLVANDTGIPFLVFLGDWAVQGGSILQSILSRPACRDLTEEAFRELAAEPGCVLLLDGWNELSAEARRRARVELETLKAELPKLGLVISTRKQASDVPLPGTHVELQSLDESQQKQIAVALRGDDGARLVDEAWRTGGVRDLVSIPLYLRALLTLPQGAPMPDTREAVLRLFVDAHTSSPQHAEALHGAMGDHVEAYLAALAETTTQNVTTTIGDKDARATITRVADNLVNQGQLAQRPEPAAVLNVLVDHHLLSRADAGSGLSFQHQQFQEWYASIGVEQQMSQALDDPAISAHLKSDILNQPAWEEAILFAIERMSRGNDKLVNVCAVAIREAFVVDPMLAAKMIYRSTEDVWSQVQAVIEARVRHWHTMDEVDRGLRFMLVSGRPEFIDLVWPLITNEDDQVSLRALRQCDVFQPSILGEAAAENIAVLPTPVREVLLSEMAHNSGLDGMRLATEIARNDPEPGVKASVVDAFAFRRAHRHIIDILEHADDATYDLISHKDLIDTVDDETVMQRVAAARKRLAGEATSHVDRLRRILASQDDEDRSADIISIISEMELSAGRDEGANLIYRLHEHYPDAVAEGLLARVQSDQRLFHGADDLLCASGIRQDGDDWVELALVAASRDARAEAAASILGPEAAGRVIDALLETERKLESGEHARQDMRDRYHDLRIRIAHLPATSLISAVQARADSDDPVIVAHLAELLSRHHETGQDLIRGFSEEEGAAIRVLLLDWGNTLLASPDTTRMHLETLARLASCVADVSLLPLLQSLLDENLQRLRVLREAYKSTGSRDIQLRSELQHPHTQGYHHAFIAIDVPETITMMKDYLTDSDFGVLAASVLSTQWLEKHEPSTDRWLLHGVDFGNVQAKREQRTQYPEATSEEAEAIFVAVGQLLAEDNEASQQRAVELGTLAVRLPHDQRDDLINKLIELAPWRARSRLFLNLILSGETVESKLVMAGLAETLKQAEEHPWIIDQSEGFEWRRWLQVIPFTTQPEVALDALTLIPEGYRLPSYLTELLRALAETPSLGAEDVLFQLADNIPQLYGDHGWRDAVFNLDGASAGIRLVDLIVSGALHEYLRDEWYLVHQLGAQIARQPPLREHIYGLLKDADDTEASALLARAVAEVPDTEGVLLLVELENRFERALLTCRSVEKLVTEQVPVADWDGAYNIVPAPAAELRQRLLERVTNGGSGDAAARCLREIDTVRDEYGIPLLEPRHPDLASGIAWPIMVSEAAERSA